MLQILGLRVTVARHVKVATRSDIWLSFAAGGGIHIPDPFFGVEESLNLLTIWFPDNEHLFVQ